MIVAKIESASPIVIIHLDPNISLHLDPNLIVAPAHSISKGPPIGVSELEEL